MHFLSIISLVAVAISFGTMLFQYINIYFPDIVSDYGYFNRSAYLGTIRYALAALIVFLPVFVWTSRFLNKDINENPEKRDLKIRKWLLYFTLFVAALVIIGDLIVLIRSFLEGELTRRFILKILSILFIAGSIFYYYLNELRDTKNANEKKIVIFSWAIILILIAGGVFGFVVAGSPQSQRLVRLDERRVGDLQMIQGQIVQYWQSKQKLPQNLDELKNDITGFKVPVDPATGKPYEYAALSGLKFRLCGEFNTESTSQANDPALRPISEPYGLGKVENWDHGKGRVCFDRTIDPEIIRPFEKTKSAPASGY